MAPVRAWHLCIPVFRVAPALKEGAAVDTLLMLRKQGVATVYTTFLYFRSRFI